MIIEELEKKLKQLRMCYDHRDEHRSVDAQEEKKAIDNLEIEIRKLRERGGVPVFGLEKSWEIAKIDLGEFEWIVLEPPNKALHRIKTE